MIGLRRLIRHRLDTVEITGSVLYDLLFGRTAKPYFPTIPDVIPDEPQTQDASPSGQSTSIDPDQ